MSFFNIILSTTLQDGKLKIPNKFSHAHGNKFSDSITLYVPSGGGGGWNVAVKREPDNTIWLDCGLLKFIQDNSIELGYFLTFTYEGDSKFVVHIFDLSATETPYICSNNSTRSNVVSETDDSFEPESGDEDSYRVSSEYTVDSFEFASKDDCTRVSHQADEVERSYFTRSKRQVNDVGIHAKGSRGNASAADGNSGQSKKRGKYPLKYRDPTRRSDGINATRRERCVDARTIQQSFQTTMKSSHIHHGNLLVPIEFVKMNVPPSTRLIKLVNADNNDEWEVGWIRHRSSYLLSSGWQQFVNDNKLMVGDICGFELVRSKEIKLKVTIFRNTGRNVGGNASSTENAGNVLFRPFFEVTIKFYKLERHILRIPASFALHLPRSTTDIKLVDTEGNEWPVRLVSGARYHLSKGWWKFMKKKKLQVGDVCVFELIQSCGKVVLKVTIHKNVV